ncbi:10178_t:CDS:2 [Diversispora eburnea]|uniref:10178_t:CDS:1 n=1 Tax=Diversispora eburnea TaxID=1213867 RepID=A0A9N9F903_9GLOM|nr:10178_t:CDS:2 [Diversispora eburnea]
MASEYGLELKYLDRFHDIYNKMKEKRQHRDLLYKMGVIRHKKQSGVMSQDEWEAAVYMFYPIRTAKTIQQSNIGTSSSTFLGNVFLERIKSEGIRGLFKGVGIYAIGSISGRLIHFSTYDALRERVYRKRGNSSSLPLGLKWLEGYKPSTINALLGTFSALTTSTFMVPFDVVSQHLQISKRLPTNFINTSLNNNNLGGSSGINNNMKIPKRTIFTINSLFQTSSSPSSSSSSITASHNDLPTFLSSSNFLCSMTAGAAAGITGTITSNPFDIGFKGLFVGMSARMWIIVPLGSLNFWVFEKVKNWMSVYLKPKSKRSMYFTDLVEKYDEIVLKPCEPKNTKWRHASKEKRTWLEDNSTNYIDFNSDINKQITRMQNYIEEQKNEIAELKKPLQRSYDNMNKMQNLYDEQCKNNEVLIRQWNSRFTNQQKRIDAIVEIANAERASLFDDLESLIRNSTRFSMEKIQLALSAIKYSIALSKMITNIDNHITRSRSYYRFQKWFEELSKQEEPLPEGILFLAFDNEQRRQKLSRPRI